MKKVKKIITGFLTVFLFMTMVLPMTTVKASEEKEVAEKRMYTVTFRAGNIACFDTDVNEAAITEIAKMNPVYFVMRDSSMSSDNVADNFDQIFQHYSKDTVRRIL